MITITVTLFNYEQFITSTLADVAAQTHPCLELVIVDDCSSDNSTSAARAWIEKNFARFVSTRMVRHRTNQGLAESRNTAFRLATSEYVFVLDADNGIYPRAIARLFEALKMSGQAGAYSQVELFGEQAGVGHADIWDPEHFSHGNYIDAMALVTKSAWMAVGGYSYMDVVGWEDFDFWCKFIGAGLHCAYVPEILCRYRVHGKSMLRTQTNPRIELLCQEMVLRHPWMTFSIAPMDELVRQNKAIIARIDELVRQKDEMVRRNKALIAEKDEAVRQNKAIIARIDELVRQKDEMARRNEALIAEKDDVEYRYRAAIGEAEALRQIIEVIRKSVSWRASMPIRAVGRVVRMLAGQPLPKTGSLLAAANLKGDIPEGFGAPPRGRGVPLRETGSVLTAANLKENIPDRPRSPPVDQPGRGVAILTRLPFFDPDEYLKVNSDVAHAGAEPIEHYWSSGRAECRSFISSIGAARVIARYNHCADATVRFPYLDRAQTPEVSLGTHLRVALLTGSRDNYYMDEIADHVAHGLMDLGVTAIRSNETFHDLDAVDYAIIIAPHEFFSPETPEFWKTALSSPKVSVLNTEQLQTPYFTRSLPHILQAGKVIDINYQMAAMFQDAGLETLYYLPGYVENSTSYPKFPELPWHPLTEGLPKAVWDYSLDRDDLAYRPIDITFVGKASPIRNDFLARNNSFFASRLCQINYRQRNEPMPLGSLTAEMPRLNSAIGRRSKIVLNIHRDGIGYFEWMRIVCQGIWQKAVVVSNPCLAHPIFKPGEHFFEESLSRIPKLLAWLLDSEEGRAEADRARRAAFETLVQRCSLRASTVALLSFLQRESITAPRPHFSHQSNTGMLRPEITPDLSMIA